MSGPNLYLPEWLVFGGEYSVSESTYEIHKKRTLSETRLTAFVSVPGFLVKSENEFLHDEATLYPVTLDNKSTRNMATKLWGAHLATF